MRDLPPDLPPSQRAAVEALLSEVSEAVHREHRTIKDYEPSNRCYVCFKEGRLVEMRTATGQRAQAHPRCRRKANK